MQLFSYLVIIRVMGKRQYFCNKLACKLLYLNLCYRNFGILFPSTWGVAKSCIKEGKQGSFLSTAGEPYSRTPLLY